MKTFKEEQAEPIEPWVSLCEGINLPLCPQHKRYCRHHVSSYVAKGLDWDLNRSEVETVKFLHNVINACWFLLKYRNLGSLESFHGPWKEDSLPKQLEKYIEEAKNGS